MYPLTMRVVEAPRMILQPVFAFFPVLHCPLGLCKLQACPFPDIVFPPLPLSALSSSPFRCSLQDGFGQTWWTLNMTIPLQFASLYNGLRVVRLPNGSWCKMNVLWLILKALFGIYQSLASCYASACGPNMVATLQAFCRMVHDTSMS